MKRKLVKIITALIGAVALIVSLLPPVRAAFEYFYIIAIVGGIMCAAAIVSLLPKQKDGVELTSEYKRKPTLVSNSEREYLELLRNIDPDRYEVVPQVALVSVIDKTTNTGYRNELFRIADFCFVDKDTFAPLLLVELNDATHHRADRKQRDEKVNAICENAGLPLVTFWLSDRLDFATVRKTVLKNILKR